MSKNTTTNLCSLLAERIIRHETSSHFKRLSALSFVIKAPQLILIVLFCSSPTFAQVPNRLTNEEKIFGLSTFWQEVNYNFVYYARVDKQAWNNLYLKLIGEVQQTKNNYEYYRLLERFSAFLKDGHTNIYYPKEIRDNLSCTDFGNYKIVLSNIEGKPIVTKVNHSMRNELPIGTEITKVNGLPVAEYINTFVRPFISTSSPHVLEDLVITRMLTAYTGTSFDLELKARNGSVSNISITRAKTREKELFPPAEKEHLFEFKWITTDIAYISFNSFSDWDIMDLFERKASEMRKAKRLIIDLRKNGGGDESIARELFKYLTTDTLLYGSRSQTRQHISTYKAWGKSVKPADTMNVWLKTYFLNYHDRYYHVFPYQPYSTANLGIERMKVPTAILIGHGTASAAEDFLVYASNQDNVILVGEPTYGSSGQPFTFDLPGGGTGRVCTKKVTFPNGKEFIGVGIQTNLFIKPTLDDYLANRDVVLENAIHYLKSK